MLIPFCFPRLFSTSFEIRQRWRGHLSEILPDSLGISAFCAEHRDPPLQLLLSEPRAPCLLGWVAARGPAANTCSVEDSLLPSLSLSAGGCWCWDWGMLPPFSSSSRSWLTARTDIPACSNGTVLSCLNPTVLVMLCDRCHLVAWFYFFNDSLSWLSLFYFVLLFK